MAMLGFLVKLFPVVLLTFHGIESFLVDEDTTKPCQSCGFCSCRDVLTNANPRPVVTLTNGMEVVCDVITDDGGWIVFQRRASKDVDFYRTWDEYKYGFGDVHGNFWMGLEKVHKLTSERSYELRVDLTFNGTNYFATYSSFMLYGEPENYKLMVSGYSGTAGDSLDRHNGRPFTTKDKDNDSHAQNCAQKYHGGWWYLACHSANLNGMYGDTTYGQGLSWHASQDYYHSASFSEMKIRTLNN